MMESLDTPAVASSAPATQAPPTPSSHSLQELLAVNLDTIKWISDRFSGRIIHWTAHSKDWQGQPLNSLVEPQRQHVFIDTSPADISRLHTIQENEGKDRFAFFKLLGSGVRLTYYIVYQVWEG
jgi:hypothetical protein